MIPWWMWIDGLWRGHGVPQQLLRHLVAAHRHDCGESGQSTSGLV
jgi:hypothetical protein